MSAQKGHFSAIDGIVMDAGVSSMQPDQGERGFIFNGPLDMRMARLTLPMDGEGDLN